MSKYWIKFRWADKHACWQEPVSCFVTTGEGEDFTDLEAWWRFESRGCLTHELLEVVKL
ncbi:hypothetical protein [Vibrio phage vB_VibM_10AMN]|uniref:Uncharacterized protein n=1 Tax=Staphylococcus phage vB_VibM_10AMN12 TaxID=3076785 RepID=A0AA96QZI1_9CAUD|nr:hypothetical protein [Vibrio phage vB_VibM_10AMN]WNO47528.1 hypothetical protein [Staphylococcus phage vB_VibM_10AMN12]